MAIVYILDAALPALPVQMAWAYITMAYITMAFMVSLIMGIAAGTQDHGLLLEFQRDWFGR